MALFRKLFYRKPPDGLLEISERVYVFDCCFTTDAWEEKDFKGYVGGIITQLRDQYPDASILVFNFREGETQSLIANALSEYDMTIMEYPRQYEGCPLLPMEVIHHFLRSSESWLSLGLQNLLLMHCDRGGWPVLAFMLAALLIYRKQYSGEHKTLDMVYKQAPRELLHLLSPLNPIPSQLRYLQYVARRNIATEWPPLDRALTMDCVIIRMIPDFDGEGGCRPIFRIYGQDPLLVSDRAPKVLFSTPKKGRNVRHYKQAESELVKIDINCHIQGDVVLECICLNDDLQCEEMMFRIMFNTAFIRSNILMLNRDEIDILWDAKDRFPKDFRAEIIFSEMDAATSTVPVEFSCFEEKDGLPVEAFAKVHEIFSSVDWIVPKGDAAAEVLQHISISDAVSESYSRSEKPQEIQHISALEYNAKISGDLSLAFPDNLSTPKLTPSMNAGKKQAGPESVGPIASSDQTSIHPGECSPSSLTSSPNQFSMAKTLHQSPEQTESQAQQSGIINEVPNEVERSVLTTPQAQLESVVPPLILHSEDEKGVQDTVITVPHQNEVIHSTSDPILWNKPVVTSEMFVPSLQISKSNYTDNACIPPKPEPCSTVDVTKSIEVATPPVPPPPPPRPSTYHPSGADVERYTRVGHPPAPEIPPKPEPCSTVDVTKSIGVATPPVPPPPPPRPSTYHSSDVDVERYTRVGHPPAPEIPASTLNDMRSPKGGATSIISPPPPPPPPPPTPPDHFSSSLMKDASQKIVPLAPSPHPEVLPNALEKKSAAMFGKIPPPPPPPPISPLKEHLVGGDESPPRFPLTPPLTESVPSRFASSPPPPSPDSLIEGSSERKVPRRQPSQTTSLSPKVVPLPPPPPPLTPPLPDNSVRKAAPVPPPPPPQTTSLSSNVVPLPPPPPPLTPPLPDNSVWKAAPVPPPPPPQTTSSSSKVVPLPPPPLPPPPPPPLTRPLPDNSVFKAAPVPVPPPPPPPPRPSKEGSSIKGSPPLPPPPPLDSRQGTGSIKPSTVSPPPPPPAPAAPPPPFLANRDGANFSNSVSPSSNRDSTSPGSPSPPGPPPPSIPPAGIKGKSLLSRTVTSRNNQTKKLKPLHWLKISRAVSGSLWADAQKSGEATKAPEIDISELESLFSAAVPNADQGSSGKKAGSRASMSQKAEKVQLIDHRRAYNCEIMLSKVKIPLHDLLSSVLALEESALDVDQVDNLIKFCPTKEEMELLKGYKGEKDKLGKCEQFFMELMQVPRIESKLRVFSFKIQFRSQVSDLRNSLNVVNSAADQIRGSAKLKRVMQTILSLGNALNQGTARGSAIGFRLDSLLKLTETRARNNRMTLMHYLCKVLADKLPELLDFWQDLSNLELASKIQLKYLAEEMQAVNKGLEKVVQELSMSENDGPVSDNFRKALKEFLCFSESEVRSLASLYSGVGRNVDALILYFGEDPARCPFEQVISTLLNFVRMFKKAHEENCKQLEFERKKAEKEAANEKQKNAPGTEHLLPSPLRSVK